MNLQEAIRNYKERGIGSTAAYSELVGYAGFLHLTLSEFEDAWYERGR